MKQNILIAGATGFVGSAIVDYLNQKKYNVYGMVRNNYQSNFSNIKYFTLDNLLELKNEDFLLSIDTIIHAAGRAHIRFAFLKKNKDKLFNDNIMLTRKLGDIAVKSNIKNFIYISTAKVYGEETYKKNVFNEKYIPSPKQEYSKSKYTAEQELLKRLKKSSINLTIIRPPMIFGKTPNGNLKILIKAIKNNIPIPISIIPNQRSFLGLENLCLFIENILIKKIASNLIYNVSDGLPISTKELTNAIGLAINKKVRYLFIPNMILEILLKLPLISNMLKPLFKDFVIKSLYESHIKKKILLVSTKKLIQKNYSNIS